MARSPSRARVRNRPVPFRQGSLDALCGIYAIVNAIGCLCPELKPDGARALFARLIRMLRHVRRKAVKTVWSGLTIQQVRALLRHALRWTKRKIGIRLKLRRLRRSVREDPKLASVWAELRQRLGKSAVAIIGIGGVEAHWSVAVRAGRTWLTLIDSDGLTALKRSACAAVPCQRRYVLDPNEILLISKHHMLAAAHRVY